MPLFDKETTSKLTTNNNTSLPLLTTHDECVSCGLFVLTDYMKEALPLLYVAAINCALVPIDCL